MARRARETSKTGIYHIVVRGINRQTIFEDVEDKRKLLHIIYKYKHISRFELYGYCLMDNHIHLLVREREESISKFFKRISSSYVYWYNAKYERCGHLFQARFSSEVVEDKHYFLTVLRYIHQNPLKAKLVKNVYESKWTSIHDYLGKTKIVDTEMAFKLFSDNKRQAVERFKEFMEKQNSDKCLDIYEKIRTDDSEIRAYMRGLGIPSSSYLQQMEPWSRNEIIAKL